MNNKTLKYVIIGIVAIALLMVGMVLAQGDRNVSVYSKGLDKYGYYKGVTATDYVTLPEDYKSITIPTSEITATEEEIETTIENLLAQYATSEEITDRAVEDGDTCSIDYTGYIDGEAFENGSEEDAEVIAGSSMYVDDFLTQIIGHMPGETFDIEVTFPEDYNHEELAGKDATFTITINYIKEEYNPEFNDEFVLENIAEDTGILSASDYREYIVMVIEEEKYDDYIYDYLIENSVVSEIPQALLDYQENYLIAYYQSMAYTYEQYYGISYETFLSYYGFESEEDMLEQSQDDITELATHALIYQAIAEIEGIKPTKADAVAAFEAENEGYSYDDYVDSLGKPYFANLALNSLVKEIVYAGVTEVDE